MGRFFAAFLFISVAIALALPLSEAAQRAKKAETERKRNENIERRFQQSYEKLNAAFVKKATALAASAAEKGLPDEVAELWEYVKEFGTEPAVEPPKLGEAECTDKEKAAIAAKIQALYRDHASELLNLGSNCFKSGLMGRACDMVWETIRFNPDNERARKILGQVKYNKQWMEKYDAMQMSMGKMFKDEYGWVTKAELGKLEAGMLPLRGQWLPKETVEKIRGGWDSAWEYGTEHYVVKTNVSLADAVAFGKVLEENYDLFFRVFIGYFSAKSQGEMLFGTKRENKPMKVNYYATKEEFASGIGSKNTAAAGMYVGHMKSANFFKLDWNTNLRVLKHEATHQLFFESRSVGSGSRYGAWVVEAGATYMETCTRNDKGRIITEGRNAPWVKMFKGLLQNGQAKPLREFDQLTYEGFQGIANVAYPQAAALACFLMEAQDGCYRERLVDYMEAYYTGRLRKLGEIENYLGVSIEDLEKEFHEFILDAQPAN